MKTLLLSLLLITSYVSEAQTITLTPIDPANPDKGTLVFDNVTNLLKYWNGTIWIPVTNAASGSGWVAAGSHIYNANEGNVGIGTNNPVAPLNVGAGKTVLFGADTSGKGRKLIWYPTKGALRAGSINSAGYNDNWDYEKIGENSIALGHNPLASGLSSVALGHFAFATGYMSAAIGSSAKASGSNSIAIGVSAEASASQAMAFGSETKATGYSSLATGDYSNASGDYSIAMGYKSEAIGDHSLALGYLAKVSSNYGTAIGRNNADIDDAIFMVGYSTNPDNPKNVFTVMKNGNVGIGTNSPIAPLHISAANQINETNNRYFNFSTGTDVASLANGAYFVGLLVDYNIVTSSSFIASQSYTSSDARIKNVVGFSDNKQDLNRLQQIKITDYTYKDMVNRGSQNFKKVIAQQVEAVYPEAVNKITSVIPDIYSLAETINYDAANKHLSITLSKSYDLKAGDKVKLVHAIEGEVLAEIESVSGRTFTVKNWTFNTEKIFVYGREVNDFRVVDYEALSMLGISAIQQLAKEIEELKKQSSEVEELKKQNKLLKTDFTARLEVLESRLIK